MEIKDILTEKIIACSFKVHSELGPGLKEKIYQNALKIMFEKENLKYETEKTFNVYFQTKKVGMLKLDLVIDSKVVVEVKAVTGKLPDIFEYQLLSYLKASHLPVGLLINFGNKSCEVKRFSV